MKSKIILIIASIAMMIFSSPLPMASEGVAELESKIETKDNTWVQDYMSQGVLNADDAAEKIFQDTFSMDTVEESISVVNNRIEELFNNYIPKEDIRKTLSKLVGLCIHNIGGMTYGLYGRYKGEKVSPHLIVAHYVNAFLNQSDLPLSQDLMTRFKWGNKSLTQYLKDNPIDEARKYNDQFNNLNERVHESLIAAQSPEIIYRLGKDYEKGKKYRGPKIQEAIKYYEMAANKDDIKSLFELIKIYSFSEFENKTKRDKALIKLKGVAEKGSVQANVYLGQLAESHVYLEDKNLNYMDVAIKHYEAASRLGSPAASLRLGQIYESHQDVVNNLDKAASFYLAAAQQGNLESVAALIRMSNEGNGEASLFLGKIYSSGSHGVGKDINQAINYFKKALEQGNGEAFLELGKMYSSGSQGVDKAINQTVDSFINLKDDNMKNKALVELEGLAKTGSRQDMATANLYLGILAGKGIDFKGINIKNMNANKKLMAAIKYYEIAFQLGNAVAPFRVGKIYEKIHEIHQDAKMLFGAMVFYAEAAKMGSVEAVDSLERTEQALEKISEQGNGELSFQRGQFYEADGIKHNIEKAISYYTKAAIQGNTETLVALGGISETGKDGKKDVYLAAYYYLIASDQKNNIAKRKLNNLYKQYSFNRCEQYGYPETVTNCAPMVLYQYVALHRSRLDVPIELLTRVEVIIGKLYETGDGISKDIDLAAGYYSDAAANGNQEAISKLEKLSQAGSSAASLAMAKRYCPYDAVTYFKDCFGYTTSFTKGMDYYIKASSQGGTKARSAAWKYLKAMADEIQRNRKLAKEKDDDYKLKWIDEKEKTYFDLLYKYKLNHFSKFIFYDIPEPIGEKYISSTQYQGEIEQKAGKVIYNNEFYCQGEQCDECTNCIKGNELFLDDNDMSEAQKIIIHTDDKNLENYTIDKKVPIGYNIYLPAGEIKEIKGIYVDVYGGNRADDVVKGVNEELKMPSNTLNAVDSFLLTQGIAVVKLNLINQLMLYDHQDYMSEGLHALLHESIDKFFQTLKYRPDELMQDFKIPENVKIVLYGRSWGGRTAVRHAELYPNTFDGYISHDGALSWISGWEGIFKDLKVFERNERRNKHKHYAKWLSPVDDDIDIDAIKKLKNYTDEKINKIEKPVVILHNYDDNIVPVRTSLAFFKRAELTKKSNLVHLFITKRGNPFPEEETNIYKGHFLTEDKEAFQSYAATIASFILDGLSKFPKVSKWMYRQYEILASKNNPGAKLEEQFTSEAYRLYIDFLNKKGGKLYSFEEEWKNKYAPLYALLAYMDMLKKDRIAFKNEIDTLKDISDEVAGNAILQQLPKFNEYSHELYGISLPKNVSEGEFSGGQVAEYRTMLGDSLNDPDFGIYLIYTLYIGNPEILREKINKLVLDQKYAEMYLAENATEAKENLRLRIQEHTDFLKSRSGQEEIREQAFKTGVL